MLTANSQRCPVSILSTLYLNHPTSPFPLALKLVACPVWDTQHAPQLQAALCRSSRGARVKSIFLQQDMHAYVYICACIYVQANPAHPHFGW